MRDFEDWNWETTTLYRTAIYVRDFVKGVFAYGTSD